MIETAEEFVRLRMSALPDEYQRAANEAASLDVWHAIVAGWPEMRKWVAHNKTVPIEILEVLSRDENPEVRVAVALKRKLTRTIFERLAADLDESVRARIACNPKAPRDVFERLSRDTSSLVSDAATRRMGGIGGPDDE